MIHKDEKELKAESKMYDKAMEYLFFRIFDVIYGKHPKKFEDTIHENADSIYIAALARSTAMVATGVTVPKGIKIRDYYERAMHFKWYFDKKFMDEVNEGARECAREKSAIKKHSKNDPKEKEVSKEMLH